MDKVIYLDPDEEITSALDKIKNTEDKGIILVVPKGATLLQSLVNLKLLSKRAIDLKKEIALVTSDKIGRNLASLVGFSVYSDIKEKAKIKPKEPVLSSSPSVVIKSYVPSQDRLEEPPPAKNQAEPPVDETIKIEPPQEKEVIHAEHKEKKFNLPQVNLPQVQMPKLPKMKIPEISWGLWGGLFAGFALVFIILYLILPKATLTILVKTSDFAQQTEIIVDSKAEAIDSGSKIIPGFPMETEKEDSKKFDATGKKNVGIKASGTILISNSSKNSDGSGVSLPLKANVEVKDKKTGKIFLTASSVTVSALTYSCDPKIGVCNSVSGTANVKIIAKEPGAGYNLGPSDFVFPGLGNAPVTARCDGGITGGNDKYATVVSDEDIARAKTETEKEILDKAKDELNSNLEKGQKIIDGAIKTEIISSSPSVATNSEATQFEMKMKIKAMTMAVKEKDYNEVLTQFVESIMPFDKRLIGNATDSTSFSLNSYDNKNQIMKVKAEIKAKVASKIDENKVKSDVAKKPKEEAINYIKAINEVQDVSISNFPYWSKKLPQSEKIKIKLTP